MWMPLWIKHQSTVTPQAATNSATGAPVRYFQFSKNKQRNGEPFSAASIMRSGSQIAENDARKARRWPEIIRNLNFWPSKKSTFLMPAYRFSLWLWHLTSFLKRLNTTLPCWNLQPKVSRTYDLRIWSWTCKCHMKVKTSSVCPSEPWNMRNRGEGFAPFSIFRPLIYRYTPSSENEN